MIGHQLDTPLNPLEVPEDTTIPIIPTELLNDQEDDIITAPEHLDLQELGPLFEQDTPITVKNRRIPV